MKKIRLLSLAMVCSMLFCTPVMAAEITTTEDAVIENNPEVVTESLESVKLEEMSPISLSEEQYDVLSDDEIQTYGTTPDDYEENDSPTTAFSYSKVETLTTHLPDFQWDSHPCPSVQETTVHRTFSSQNQASGRYTDLSQHDTAYHPGFRSVLRLPW